MCAPYGEKGVFECVFSEWLLCHLESSSNLSILTLKYIENHNDEQFLTSTWKWTICVLVCSWKESLNTQDIGLLSEFYSDFWHTSQELHSSNE